MKYRPNVSTPAAEKIRNILTDPPRSGWSRRSFLTRNSDIFPLDRC
jgi:hypothetical protein